MTLIDLVSRFIPGVLNMKHRQRKILCWMGCWIAPTHTRPEVLEEMEHRQHCLSGNHAEIRRWRLKQSLAAPGLEDPNF